MTRTGRYMPAFNSAAAATSAYRHLTSTSCKTQSLPRTTDRTTAMSDSTELVEVSSILPSLDFRGLVVKASKILFVYLCLLMFGCANLEKAGNRDYAFDTYYPTPNEIQLAQQRA